MELPQHCNGRAFVHQGITYYSPNCKNPVVPPPQRSDNDYRFPASECKLEGFTNPQWWSSFYGWLAFVPTGSIEFDKTALFKPLEDVTAWPVGEMKLGIGEHRLQEWSRLEDILFYLIATTVTQYNLQGFFKPAPISSLRPRTTRHNVICANEFVKSIRDWIVMWMALLSFMLARVGDRWSVEIPNHGVDYAIVDQIIGSAVCDFTSKERAGVFIDPLAPNQKTRPPIQFFVNHNVPVWYIWSEEHGKSLQANENIPSELLPSRSELARAQNTANSTIPLVIPFPLPANPDPPASTVARKRGKPRRGVESVARQRVIDSAPWVAFFEKRALENLEKEKTESAKDKQKRISRTRKNPTVKGFKPYVWDWDVDSSTPVLKRRLITLAEWADDCHSAAKHQKKYCPYRNEWDYCEYFESDKEWARKENVRVAEWEDEVLSALQPPQIPDDAPVKEGTSSISRQDELRLHEEENRKRSCMTSMKQMVAALQAQVPEHPVLFNSSDLISCLYYRHGFVVPKKPSRELVEHKRWSNALGALCRLKSSPTSQAQGHEQAIITFIESLKEGKLPPSDLYDLSPANPTAITSPDFSQLFERKGMWLLIRREVFANSEVDAWQLCVSDISDAVFLYRQVLNTEPGKLTRNILVQSLMDICVPFNTFSEGSPCSTTSIHCMVPYRMSGHHFTQAEYTNYLSIRRNFLLSSRGRAALLSGGIVARLAQDDIGIESVLSGPSLDATEYGVGISYENDGETYIDDNLTKDELALVCGLYYEYSGNGNNKLHMSWWPPQHQWMNKQSCGTHCRYWSEVNEDWYQRRLADIRAGTAQPLSAMDWLKRLRGLKYCVRVAETTSSLASGLLKVL